MKKRNLAMMLGAAMLIGTLGSSGITASAEEIALDHFAGTELTIALLKSEIDTIAESPAVKVAAQMAEEATGIKINWIAVDNAAKAEKTSVMLASDMPDAMIGLLDENTMASNLDLFYDLSEEGLLETYAPNILADLESVNGGKGVVTWPDGTIRSLPTSNETSLSSYVQGVWMINQAWLDQLGLDQPTNWDEFYEILCAFRDNDMNGNGDPNDEIPFTFTQYLNLAEIYGFANFFGIGGDTFVNEGVVEMGKQIKDGKVEATFATENFRIFLEKCHQMYDEGLMDAEGFSQTFEQFEAKCGQGLVGVFCGWDPSVYMDAEMAADYVMLQPFSAIEGVEYVQTGVEKAFGANRTGFAVSADCENVEALLHWWNYLGSSTTMKYICRWGYEGDMWDYNEDGYAYTHDPKELPEGMNQTQYAYMVGLLEGGKFPMARADEIMPPTSFRGLCIPDLIPYMAKESMPVKFVDPDKTEERSFIEIELSAYADNFLSTSITEGVTDESWAAHLEQLKAVQYYEWIDWWQGFYDGSF